MYFRWLASQSKVIDLANAGTVDVAVRAPCQKVSFGFQPQLYGPVAEILPAVAGPSPRVSAWAPRGDSIVVQSNNQNHDK